MVISLEDKQYYYNGGVIDSSERVLKKGWSMDRSEFGGTEWVERNYPFSRMNNGMGWLVGRDKGYLLSLHSISSFINWPSRNPMEVKE